MTEDSGEPQPWWYRALEPLRSEAAMFRVLLYVIAVFIVGVAIKLVVDAIS